MIEIEDALIDKLSVENKVDGHDAGSGEMNISIWTDSPERTVSEVKRILGSRDCWGDARVAYREAGADHYSILWPKELNEFNVS
jgi:hypothetical protein